MNGTNLIEQPRKGMVNLQGILFWTWNIIFLALMIFGFIPEEFPQLIRSIQFGTTPAVYLVFALVLVLIPLAAFLLGIFVLRKSPSRLFALGYVLEWPLLLILMFRFFLIREGNPAITILLIWLAVALAVFLWHLIDRRLDERPQGWKYLRLAGLSLLFAGTIYAAVWLAFYVPPIAVFIYQMVRSVVEAVIDFFRHPNGINSLEALRLLLISTLGFLLLLFSGSLILVMPVAAPVLAGRAWLHSLRSAFEKGKRWITWAVCLIPLAGVVLLLALSMRQPQLEAFALLENPPATLEQAQDLLQKQDAIRSGLVNAYLAPYRYISAIGEVRHVSDLYHYNLKMDLDTSLKFEQAYEYVILPLLYVPVHPTQYFSQDNTIFNTESDEAATLYQRFFDHPIVKGERAEIVAAVRSNPDGNQAEVAWQSVDNREVFLTRQEVNVEEHSDWANVEIHEVYQNRTATRKEVVYYFNLPESAVVTGLWLGSKPDRSQAFAYQVAPRGAAQAVYRNEIRMNRDPAIVEQIGPRQYRLRAFPVEPHPRVAISDPPQLGPELHLWLTYRVMAQENAWPLPQLAEKFNVFWDDSSTRLINNQPLPANTTGWLPLTVPASQPVVPAVHRMDFPGGQTVIARPVTSDGTFPSMDGLRLAVVLDRSYSMKEHAAEIQTVLSNLKTTANPGGQTDIFLTSSPYRGESASETTLASFRPDHVVYFGGQNAAELLAQFEQLQSGRNYDAILILTDASGYELGQSDMQITIPDAPVWIVHLGGGLPLGYDDTTQQAVQASGGGIAGSLEEALTRLYAARSGAGVLDIVDGYEWQTLPTSQTGLLPASMEVSQSEDEGFAALAARRVILAEMVKHQGSLDELPILDQLHQLAIQNSIVTPYSSMLVLVDPRQQTLLDKLEDQADRFQREVENIGNTSRVNPNFVTGVPEPQEWLLIVLAVLALGFAYRKRMVQKNTV